VKASSRPFRSRLTTWYGTLLAVSFVILGVGLYFGLRGLLFESFEEQLQNQTALTLVNTTLTSSGPEIDPVMLATLMDDEHFVRLITSDGTVLLDTTVQFGIDPIEPDLVASSLTGKTFLFTVVGEEEAFGTVVTPIEQGGRTVGVLQLGLSRGDIDETLRLVVVVLGIATPIVLIIAIVGGYVVAGRAIAPVATITNLAAGLDGTDLHARLNLTLPDDELGRLARTFDGMLERIAGAFDRQRRFTGDAAHELRTPLAMMRGEVDLALRSPRSAEEYRASLVELDLDLERMTGLVSSLLMLARVDEGRIALESAPFDLSATVNLVAEQYTARAITQSINLSTDVEPAAINGDEDRCIQVLVNLLDNAFVHTPGGGEIEIGARLNANVATCWVSDTGTGVAPEHIPHLFERFYRVDTGRSRAAGGSGLGLSICRAVVESMGGTIELNSNLGRGTRVTVFLPTIPNPPISR